MIPTSIRRVAVAAITVGLLLAGIASIATAAGRYSSDASPFAVTAIDDIQAFWARTLPAVYGVDYDEIPRSRLFPYSSEDPPPACGGRSDTPYEEVSGNAFYCPANDFVAWDVERLIPGLERRFGDFAVALVLAHEWGHAVQARTDSTITATIYLENQADCFAGAWARHVDEGDSALSLDSSDLETALGGYLEFRDPPGIDPSQPGAHGNAFDRVSAFQDGFEAGADQCAGYEQDPPPVTESAYTTYEDQANGGDVPLADAVDLVEADLDHYWAQELEGGSPVADLVADERGPDDVCSAPSGGVLVDGVEYCAGDDTVVYEPDVLRRVYDATGDFGAGMVLAAEWSAAAQHELGYPVAGAAGRLLADCLTGSWAGDVASGARAGRGTRRASSSQISLSPGDLDQGIATFVALGGTDAGRSSAFERVAAFREGFFQGVDACTSGAS